MSEKFSIGLDIGTNSVGWAVVDENNEIVKKNGFALWGVRMFEEAMDASSRRSYRCSRRRLNRRKERINLLRGLFAEEIIKIDRTFFDRLDDSFFVQDDKREKCFYNILNDKSKKEFFKQNPTMYHIRKYLLEHDEKIDIRILYLALHHMIKYRGNFLYPSDEYNKQDISTIKGYFIDINKMMDEYVNLYEDNEEYFEKIDINDDVFFDNLKEIFISRDKKIDKKNRLLKLFNVSKNSLVNHCIIPLLVGSKVDISKLTFIKELQYDKTEIDITSEDFLTRIDEARVKIRDLDYLFDVLVEVKSLVDHYYLLKMLDNFNCISEIMVDIYDRHEQELKELKALVKQFAPDSYDLCFRVVDDKVNNYPKYIGMNNVNSKLERFSHCKREEFYKFIISILNKITDKKAQETIDKIKDKIENTEYLLRQNSDKNGSFPMQLNLVEMKRILNTQSKYYGFLLEKENDVSVIDKIKAIFKYKIPYYVGPLNNKSENSWVQRTNEKIYPWNFEKVVNLDESAKKFIEKMQNKCTYLRGEYDYCLPKHSLLFSEYNCLQYLNKLTINGKLITIEQKEKLYNELFLVKNPTKKDIIAYLKVNYGYDGMDSIPEVTCNMSSYIKFKEIFKEDFSNNKEIIEKIIKDIVIFEDKRILEKRLRKEYNLDEEKIKKIKDLNYKGYGRLCKRLLDGITTINKETGECQTIIEILRSTNLNLQQILFDPNYNFKEIIDKYNEKNIKKSDTFMDFIDENLYVSPIMKRPLIQTYKIIDEVEKILGQKIDKYYVECSRYEGKKEVKKSRYNALKELYKNCKDLALEFRIDLAKLNEKLDANQNSLRSDKIYFYFTQLGKCMYTLEDIDFNDILTNTKYDIDHIYPRALIKDDSLSNRVLTRKDKNNLKQDIFLFDDSLQNFLPKNAFKFYQKLLDCKLITKEKYRRLTQKEISSQELEGFVNRQLVATNQAVKGIVELLKLYHGVKQTDIIYSKAEIISDFRNEYKLPKCRDANNFHHAHDAYLNVVIGRAINNYYSYNYFAGFNDYYRLKAENKTINPLKILEFDRTIKGKVTWKKNETLKLINKNLYERFDIHETTRTYNPSEMFKKVTIMKAGTDSAIPVKISDSRSNVKLYGGICSHSYSKYIIIKTTNKKGQIEYILEAIPKVYDDGIDKNKEYLDMYYNNYEILHDNIKANIIIKENKLKYSITGRTNDCYYIQNKWDRFLDKKSITLLKKILKYLEIKNKHIPILEDDNHAILNPRRSENSDVIEITIDDLLTLSEIIIEKYDKEIYDYNIIKSIVNNFKNQYKDLKLEKLAFTLNELIRLLKTNESGVANLLSIGMKEKAGRLTIGKKLRPGMKFIYESITGYYSKLLFEVPDVI